MNFSRCWPWWALVVFWVAVISFCAGCTTVMVQVGNDNNSDDSVKVRRKVELGVTIEPKEVK